MRADVLKEDVCHVRGLSRSMRRQLQSMVHPTHAPKHMFPLGMTRDYSDINQVSVSPRSQIQFQRSCPTSAYVFLYPNEQNLVSQPKS